MHQAQLPALPGERATGLSAAHDDDVYASSAAALQLESDDTQSLLARRQGTVSEGGYCAHDELANIVCLLTHANVGRCSRYIYFTTEQQVAALLCYSNVLSGWTTPVS